MLDAVDCTATICVALGYIQTDNFTKTSVLAEQVKAPPPDAINVSGDASAGMAGSELPSHPIAYFTDTALLTRAERYSVTVDWGDGSSTTGATIKSSYTLSHCGIFVIGCFSVSAKHAFKNHGTYVVRTTVTNDATGAVASGYTIIQAVSSAEFLGPTFPPQVNIGVVDAIGKNGTVGLGCTATVLHDVDVIVTARHCGIGSAKTVEFAPYHTGNCFHGSKEVSLQECGGNPDGVFNASPADVINVPSGSKGNDPDDVDVQFIVMPNKNESGRVLHQIVPGLPALFDSPIGDSWTVHAYPARDPKRDWTLNSCGPEKGMAEYNVSPQTGSTVPLMLGLQPCAIGANDIDPSTGLPYGGESGAPYITSVSVPYGVGAVNRGECTRDKNKMYSRGCPSGLTYHGSSDAPISVGSLFEDGAMNAYTAAVLRSRNL